MRYFREKLLQVLHVVAVFRLCVLRDTASSTRSISGLNTLDTACTSSILGFDTLEYCCTLSILRFDALEYCLYLNYSGVLYCSYFEYSQYFDI